MMIVATVPTPSPEPSEPRSVPRSSWRTIDAIGAAMRTVGRHAMVDRPNVTAYRVAFVGTLRMKTIDRPTLRAYVFPEDSRYMDVLHALRFRSTDDEIDAMAGYPVPAYIPLSLLLALLRPAQDVAPARAYEPGPHPKGCAMTIKFYVCGVGSGVANPAQERYGGRPTGAASVGIDAGAGRRPAHT